MELFSNNRKRLAGLLIAIAVLSVSGRMSARHDVVALPGYLVALLNDQLAGPVELGFDGDGNIFVANEGAAQKPFGQDFVSKLDPNGVTIQRDFIGGLFGASGLAVDGDGNIYVSQDGEIRIAKYDSTGSKVFDFASHRPAFSDPNSLTLTNDGRLLAPVQAFADGKWHVIAFDIANGDLLGDYIPPFDFGFVNSVVFDNKTNRVFIAGSGVNGPTEQPVILVAAEGQAPMAYLYGMQWGFGNVNGLTLDPDGALFVSDGRRLLSVSTEGTVTPLATGFTFARGLAAKNGCVLVAEFGDGSNGALYSVCRQKVPATVELSNLTQTYTGAPLTPTATTTPPGLPIVWAGAPQTAVGTYPVTATVIDPNYEGSASGSFVINPAARPVPTNKAQCKDGGWTLLARANGTVFKNQGDCVSYTNNGK